MSFITSLGDWLRKISCSFSDVSINGRNIVLTRHNGDTKTITTQDTDTTYNNATQSVAGLMSDTDKTKLDGIAEGAEVNQDAFSYVRVGSTTIAADTKTATVELVVGSNVTLTPDATDKKITIAATDTVTTATTSGSGNAVTSITANNGALTVKKDSTFLELNDLILTSSSSSSLQELKLKLPNGVMILTHYGSFTLNSNGRFTWTFPEAFIEPPAPSCFSHYTYQLQAYTTSRANITIRMLNPDGTFITNQNGASVTCYIIVIGRWK